MRRPRRVTIALDLSDDERAAELSADVHVLRLALWRMAAFYDLRLPRDTFVIGDPSHR